MQWILQDVPIGRNIQNIRMKKNMTQAEVVGQLQLMGSSMSRCICHAGYATLRIIMPCHIEEHRLLR